MNNEGRFIWNIFRLTWSLGTLFIALCYSYSKLSSNIMILGDRFTLWLTYYIKMSCLYCRLVSLLLMTNCLPKFYIPLLTVNSTFSRVFQISFCKLCYLKIGIERTSIVWHFFQFELNFVCGSEYIWENIAMQSFWCETAIY